MDRPPPTAPLLARLRDEEDLLRAATAATAAAHAALRAGDLAAASHPDLDALAARLHAAAAARLAAVADVAAALGAPPAGLTLAALAELLPHAAADLLAARDRLAAAAADLGAVQRRHANLALHLRSYFRGVLAALTAATTPTRYGPGGAMLPPAGTAVLARG